MKPELSFGNDVQRLLLDKEISGKAFREMHAECDHAIDVIEQFKSGSLSVGVFASMAGKLDLSDPSNPRWRVFPVGRFKFRLDYFPSARRYTVFLAEPPASRKRPRRAGAAKAKDPANRPGRALKGPSPAERVQRYLYKLGEVTMSYGAILPSLHRMIAVLRLIVARGTTWLSCLSEDSPLTAEQRTVAAVLREFLPPQTAAPVAISRLERESVRISDGFRLELLKLVSASPHVPWLHWDPAWFGESVEHREMVLA